MRKVFIEKNQIKLFTTLFIIASIFLYGCWNPFAPNQGENNSLDNFLQPSSPDNLIRNFEMAYTQKNIDQYNKLFTQDFKYFTTVYINGIKTEESWDKTVEMRIANNMFRKVHKIDLSILGNNFIPYDGDIDGDGNVDSELMQSIHPVNLTVYVTPTLIYRVNQQIRFILERDQEGWKIKRWIDIVE